MAKDKDEKTNPETGDEELDFQRPSKPHFEKLKAGDMVQGIFVGVVTTRFGPGYKFRHYDKDEYFTVGGNRAQLDQIFQEVMGNPQGYNGDTIIGHAIALKRDADTQSGSGRKVAQYMIAHVFSKCPKGCKKVG